MSNTRLIGPIQESQEDAIDTGAPVWVAVTYHDGLPGNPPDLGLKIGDTIYVYYKWSDPMEVKACNVTWRPTYKREFGESIHPEQS